MYVDPFWLSFTVTLVVLCELERRGLAWLRQKSAKAMGPHAAPAHRSDIDPRPAVKTAPGTPQSGMKLNRESCDWLNALLMNVFSYWKLENKDSDWCAVLNQELLDISGEKIVGVAVRASLRKRV